ncbi:aminoglycoside phosphotransferase family protein [Streptomyces crystallinus]|uniref:Aminoglycoside phosphotransferase domain-containing protein n=1 Tax=Streptomyces crystallinus TaxID=68191 RepID=A0ABP3QCB6_9ACTN
MNVTAPSATGVRVDWGQLPEHVRRAMEARLGAPVVDAVTQRGGFSPGAAARVRLADGRRAFVKAVSAEANPGSPLLHRAEARAAATLPPTVPAPRLLAVHEDATWVALAFEDVDGRQPQVPWRAHELARVLDAMGELARTPGPADLPSVVESEGESFRGWEELLDHDCGHCRDRLDPWVRRNLASLADLAAPWGESASGDALAHGDPRADNMLLTPDGRVLFVDWPAAVRAAPWYDLVLILPSVRAQGGPDPEEVFTAHPVGRDADPDGVTATLAALTGYFVRQSLRAAPPGLPTLRPFQAALGVTALAWLRTRLGSRLP